MKEAGMKGDKMKGNEGIEDKMKVDKMKGDKPRSPNWEAHETKKKYIYIYIYIYKRIKQI